MKFTFDYYEHLVRRVEINADNLAEALTKLNNQIEKEKLVLTADDFIGAEIKMPFAENFLPQLELCGESVEKKDCGDFDLLVDMW